MSYAGQNAYSAGKTSGVLRDGASGPNRCFVPADFVWGGDEHSDEHLNEYLVNIWMKWSVEIPGPMKLIETVIYSLHRGSLGAAQGSGALKKTRGQPRGR